MSAVTTRSRYNRIDCGVNEDKHHSLILYRQRGGRRRYVCKNDKNGGCGIVTPWERDPDYVPKPSEYTVDTGFGRCVIGTTAADAVVAERLHVIFTYLKVYRHLQGQVLRPQDIIVTRAALMDQLKVYLYKACKLVGIHVTTAMYKETLVDHLLEKYELGK